MNEEKAKLIKVIQDAGLAPDEEVVIQNQATIPQLVAGLRLAADLLEAKEDQGYRLISHTDFEARINK